MYTKDLWLKRNKYRSDISSNITHFTKASDADKTLNTLIKIINDKKIIANNDSSSFIIGIEKVVCFQDAPTESLCQNLLFEQDNKSKLGNKIRYFPFGLSFSKIYGFNKGVRPVFYGKKEEIMKLLPNNEHWRIVNLDLSNSLQIIDWTHEREWRCNKDFEFDLRELTVYLPNEKYYRLFIQKIDKTILLEIKGIIVLNYIIA